MIQRRILRAKKGDPIKQVLKPQQSADTFIERVFVNDQNDNSKVVGNCDGLTESLQIEFILRIICRRSQREIALM